MEGEGRDRRPSVLPCAVVGSSPDPADDGAVRCGSEGGGKGIWYI